MGQLSLSGLIVEAVLLLLVYVLRAFLPAMGYSKFLARCHCHALGLLSYQNYEPSHFLLFINFPVSGILL